jgi:hypothetical protein
MAFCGVSKQRTAFMFTVTVFVLVDAQVLSVVADQFQVLI